MKKEYWILSAAAFIPFLSSCASDQKTTQGAPWTIKPAYTVRNSFENPEAYYQLGHYYQGQNRYEQALVAYQKALALDGKFAEARNGMGVIYSMQGKLPEAIEQLRQAVEQAPSAAHIHNNLGYALYLNGSTIEAIQVLEHALALDPSNQTTQANLTQAKAGAAVNTLPQAPQDQSAGTSSPVALDVKPLVGPQARVSPVEPSAVQVTTISQPEPRKERDSGATNKREIVPMVESSTQVVQLSTNVYELQERAESQRILAPVAQPNVQGKEQGMIMPDSQIQPKPSQIAEDRTPVGSLAQVSHVQGGKATPQVGTALAASETAKPFRIEVSNGNGLTGLAKRVSGFLRDFGYAGSRLTNRKPFHVTSTAVEYRAGYEKEAGALLSSLPGKAELYQVDNLRRDISIRVVLGKDLLHDVAFLDRVHQGQIHLARNGSDSQ